jgi:hypothetical protein
MDIQMKKADKIMKKILGLVKDEHKEMVEANVKKATNEFLALTDEEQYDWFVAEGTIGWFFDTNHLGFLEDYEAGMQMVLKNEDNEDDEFALIDLVCDYLDCYLD